jgi:hypothetical protein
MAEEITTVQPPAASNPRGHTMPTDWGELGAGYGPYKRFPDKRQLVAEYALMRKYEPTVKRTLALLESLIVGRIGQYTHPDEAIQEQVNGWLRQVEGGLNSVVSRLLSALWAGFCVMEPVWKTTGSEWTYERIELLHPLSFFNRRYDASNQRDGIQIDPVTKRVEKLQQFSGRIGDAPIEFRRDEVIYWPFAQELREQVYGSSILDGARRAWFSKTKEENFWNTHAEKCSSPIPVFRVPNSTIAHPVTKENVSLAVWLMETYRTLEPGMALALPMDPDTPFEVVPLVPVGDGGAFKLVCEYWKGEIFNAMLVPRLVLEEPEHGTRAQAGSVLDLFYQLVDGIRQQLGWVLVWQVVEPLLRYNYGEMDDMGEWGFEPLQDEDLELLAGVYESVQRGRATAATAGLQTQEADERKTRETFGAVLADANDVDLTAQPTNSARGGVDRYA